MKHCGQIRPDRSSPHRSQPKTNVLIILTCKAQIVLPRCEIDSCSTVWSFQMAPQFSGGSHQMFWSMEFVLHIWLCHSEKKKIANGVPGLTLLALITQMHWDKSLPEWLRRSENGKSSLVCHTQMELHYCYRSWPLPLLLAHLRAPEKPNTRQDKSNY